MLSFHNETRKPNSKSCKGKSSEGAKKRKLRKGEGFVIWNARKKLKPESSATESASVSDDATLAKISLLSVVAIE